VKPAYAAAGPWRGVAEERLLTALKNPPAADDALEDLMLHDTRMDDQCRRMRRPAPKPCCGRPARPPEPRRAGRRTRAVSKSCAKTPTAGRPK
jgi:hypothetical protein